MHRYPKGQLQLQLDVMQRKKLIELASILDLQNYTHSLDRWLEMPIHVRSQHQRETCFNQYLHIIKPKIHKFHHIVTVLSHAEYGFYSKDLKQAQLKVLVDSYQQLQKFEIFSQDELASLQQDGKYSYLTSEEFNALVPKPENYTYLIQLDEKPSNKELPYWGNHLHVQTLTFESIVIHGKGIARKSLGFPTANLQVTHSIQQKLNSYPNGIYLVQFTFTKGESYYGICSIGTNPHYENTLNRRLVEVYIYNDFGESMFYGAEITVTLLVLTRFQGKFSSFDQFLNAMHNDIESGRIISQRLGKL